MTSNELLIQKVRELASLLSANDQIVNDGCLIENRDLFTVDLDDCDVLTIRIDLEKI